MSAAKLPDVAHRELPPVLAGHLTGSVARRVERFYNSIEEAFEAWVTRRRSPHTQRAYRTDVQSFVRFLGLSWPRQATQLLAVSVADVLAWRDLMVGEGAAPKTLNRRVSSLSSFYRYLAGAAAEMRLPITVPNPAHAQFVARESTDPREERRALTAHSARRLLALPQGDSVLAYRDRAILSFYVYTGARITTGCRLRVRDFHDDGEATIRISEKGERRRTIGLHVAAAQAIGEYLEQGEISSGPLFRPRLNSRSQRLGSGSFHPATMYRLLEGYLRRLPGAVREGRCVYTPHSLRATTATLLLGAGTDIRKVQELLGHRHVTTTQIYDRRRIATRESASHQVPI